MKSLLIVLAMMTVSASAFADLTISIGGATYQGRGDDNRRGDGRRDDDRRGGGRDDDRRGGGNHGGGMGPGPGHGPSVEYIRCESIGGRYNECYFNGRFVRNVSLINQHSKAACIPGRTFGVGRDRIWVNEGCRATFEIRH